MRSLWMNDLRSEWGGSFFGSTDWWPLKGPLNDCSNGNHWDEWNSRRPDDVKVSKTTYAHLFGLLGQKNSLDVGKDTSLGNGDTGEKFVQFLVVPDGKLKMSGNDPCLLVVAGSVASQFENFSGQVFQDSSQVDWGTSTNSFSIVSFSKKSMDTTNWELESSSRGSRLGLWFDFSSLSTSRHVW